MIKKTPLICLVGFLGLVALCSLLYAEESGSSGDSSGSNGSWDTSGFLAPDEIQLPPFYRPYEATGKEFSLPGNPYFPNLKITSSEEIHLVVDIIITNCISFHLEPVANSTKTETVLTLSGLDPLWENNPDNVSYWRYQDGYAIEVIKDGEGKYTWTQNLSEHHVFVQPYHNTLYIGTGKPSEYYVITDTNYYTLVKDVINEGIFIVADGITLDGNGHTIQGLRYLPYGISLYERTAVTVTNCTVQGFMHGIYLEYSSFNTIISNTITNASFAGIGIHNGSNNTLINNIANLNQVGIHLLTTSNCLLAGNTMSGNEYNFRLKVNQHQDSHFDHTIDTTNTVDNKPIYYIKNATGTTYDATTNAGTIYCVWCDNVTVKNLILRNNGAGVHFFKTNNSRIENVIAENNIYGIYLFRSSTNTLIANKVNLNKWGIDLLFCPFGNVLSDNEVNENQIQGLGIVGSSHTVLSHNKVHSNQSGISLSNNTNFTTVTNNSTKSNYYWGIAATGYGHTFTNNIVDSNYFWGVRLFACHDCTFTNNSVKNTILTSYAGIHLWGSSNNQIYHNNFINNLPQAYVTPHWYAYEIVPCDNFWDNGYPSGGNYWSDYTQRYPAAVDANNDGIWDAPYIIEETIAGTNQDNFPVVAPFNEAPLVEELSLPKTGTVWGSQHPEEPTDITWTVTDLNNDALTITFYYRINDGPWFTIDTIDTSAPYTDTYTWDVSEYLDDHRYQVKVEATEIYTEEHYTATAYSGFFTIDNFPLTIQTLTPDPGEFNPSESEKTLVPFELSEPADNIMVEIKCLEDLTQWTIAGPLSREPGIRTVEWNGKDSEGNPLPSPRTFRFRVEGIDIFGNVTASGWSPTVTINSAMPVFANLDDAPDPFIPALQSTQISYTIRGWGTINTTLKIYNAMGNLVTTLFDEDPQAWGDHSVWWDGTGVTEPGIFKYEFSGYRVETGAQAYPKYGVITAIDSNTATTQSPDANLTVYSRPIDSKIKIVQDPDLATEVTNALWSIIAPGSIAPLYPVSSFYDITAVPPPDLIFPVIVALKYSVDLPPEHIKLFRYDPATKGFIAVSPDRYIVDPINHIFFAELDSFSLLVLMANRDITKPMIQDLVLTPQILNFTIQDDLSGINIPSIRVLIDKKDITDKLTITGTTGDLMVTVSGKDIYQPGLAHTIVIIAQDRAGNEVRKTVTIVTRVKLVIKPEALNINPGVLTAYLKFPEPFGIPITIEATLDGAPFEKWMVSEEGLPKEGLEGPIVIMKFRREAIEQALAEKGEILDTEFIIKGKFDDGTAPPGQLYEFEGKDTITKIITKETPPTGPPEKSKGKK